MPTVHGTVENKARESTTLEDQEEKDRSLPENGQTSTPRVVQSLSRETK